MDQESRASGRTWVGARFERLRSFLTRDIWSIELGGLPTFRALAYKIARVLYLGLSGFHKDRCLFRASGLTYYTVLSLVPLLAFSFSVAKGLGAYEKLRQETIEPFLDETIGASAAAVGSGDETSPSALGAQELRRAIDRVLEFVERTNLSSLGTVGLLILLFTVVKLLSNIEQSFNEIWGVTRSRTLMRKFSDYLSIVVIVPLFLGAATSASTAAQSNAVVTFLSERLHMGTLINFYLKVSSLFAMWIGFTLIYLFMPNTRTALRSCLIGGIVGGSLWHLAQILHVRLQIGMANYNALYSSFAAFPIFMIWLYLSWVTVLLGAEFAFAHRNAPPYRQLALSRHYDQSFKEVLCLRLMLRVTHAFLAGKSGPSTWQMAEILGVPEYSIREVVGKLRLYNILTATDPDPDSKLLPARDLDTIRVKDLFDALKGSDGKPDLPARDTLDESLDVFYGAWEREGQASPRNRNLRELAREFPEAAPSEPILFPGASREKRAAEPRS